MNPNLLFKGGTIDCLKLTRFRNGREKAFYDDLGVACDVALRKHFFSGKEPLIQVVYNIDELDIVDTPGTLHQTATGNKTIKSKVRPRDLDTLLLTLPEDLRDLSAEIKLKTGYFPMFEGEQDLGARALNVMNMIDSVGFNMTKHSNALKADTAARAVVYGAGKYAGKNSGLHYDEL